MPPTTNPTTKMTKTKVTMTILKEILGCCEPSCLWSVLLLLLVANPVLSAYSWGHPSRDWRNPEEQAEAPEFDVATSTVLARVGQPAYLPCRVRNLGDRVVSWIRTRDLHILTSGEFTYTSDSRFEVVHQQDSEMWLLKITRVQPRDHGKYECQVNTDPKINFAVQLHVRETDMKDDPSLGVPEVTPSSITASAIIEGPREQYVSRGSTVTFTCMVMAPYSIPNVPPRVVDWFHSDRLVSIQAARGGISTDTEKSDLQTKSRLTVAGVMYKDAGNYTCRPADTRPATVQLVVVEGEHTEAMQRDSPSTAARSALLSHMFLCWITAYHLLALT